MGELNLQLRQPATVPTDAIVPMSFFDELVFRHSLTEVMFRFNEPLDTEKLRTSLERLMEIGQWKNLGARIRVNNQGRFEYHIPAKYDSTRPGFILSSTEHRTSINDDPVASRLPKGTQFPSVQGSMSDYSLLTRGPDDPVRIKDWASSDLPQLLIHVVNFQDASLLRVRHPHSLMDAVGLASLLQAWTAVLHGQENEIPDVIIFPEDPRMALAEKTPAENYLYHNDVLGKLGMLCMVARLLWEKFWHPGEEERVVCVPGQLVEVMRAQAIAGQTSGMDKAGGESPFLSESDVLVAWWTQTMVSAIKPSPNKLICLLNVMDLRPVCLVPSVAYITNVLGAAYTILPAGRILEKPVSFLAAQIRHAIIQQRIPEQVQAMYALAKRAYEKSRAAALPIRPEWLLITCTNWLKCRFFQLDFAPAIRHQGFQRITGPVKPSLVLGKDVYPHVIVRNMVKVLGKDGEGRWWISTILRRSAWTDIERQLSAMKTDEVGASV